MPVIIFQIMLNKIKKAIPLFSIYRIGLLFFSDNNTLFSYKKTNHYYYGYKNKYIFK